MNPNELTKEDQILSNTTKTCEVLIGIRDDNREDRKDQRHESTKMFAGLCGVILALIGQKIIATPWYIDTAVILSLIAGTFLLVTLIAWWKEYDKTQKWTRITGAYVLLLSSVASIVIFHPGEEVPPTWYPLFINIGLIGLAISLMWTGWIQKPKNMKRK